MVDPATLSTTPGERQAPGRSSRWSDQVMGWTIRVPRGARPSLRPTQAATHTEDSFSADKMARGSDPDHSHLFPSLQIREAITLITHTHLHSAHNDLSSPGENWTLHRNLSFSEKRKFYSPFTLESRWSILKAPVLNGTFLQSKNFRSQAVLLEAGFSVFWNKVWSLMSAILLSPLFCADTV